MCKHRCLENSCWDYCLLKLEPIHDDIEELCVCATCEDYEKKII